MTDKPQVELRNIKLHKGLSEETPAYTAKAFVNGKLFANVSNQGHGGSDFYDFAKGESYDTLAALDKVIEATYPKHVYPDFEIGESFECLCHTLVWEDDEQKLFKRRLKQKVLTIEDGKVYAYKHPDQARVITKLQNEKPAAVILNVLPLAQAWEAFKAAA